MHILIYTQKLSHSHILNTHTYLHTKSLFLQTDIVYIIRKRTAQKQQQKNTHTHTHTLSLSIAVSHTHTHTLSLSLPLSLSYTHTKEKKIGYMLEGEQCISRLAHVRTERVIRITPCMMQLWITSVRVCVCVCVCVFACVCLC